MTETKYDWVMFRTTLPVGRASIRRLPNVFFRPKVKIRNVKLERWHLTSIKLILKTKISTFWKNSQTSQFYLDMKSKLETWKIKKIFLDGCKEITFLHFNKANLILYFNLATSKTFSSIIVYFFAIKSVSSFFFK